MLIFIPGLLELAHALSYTSKSNNKWMGSSTLFLLLFRQFKDNNFQLNN
jgi:hypothetical protein